MNDLQIFNYKEKPVRTIERDGEIWWVLRDVCNVLGISKTADVAARLDSDEVGQTDVVDSNGKRQMSYIVSEPGLYNVILRSDKPEAKDFKRWVTHDVLPAIRRTGSYSVVPAPQRAALPEGISLNGLARLLSVTRRIMLDMGNTPVEIGAVAKGLCDTCGIQLHPAFTSQIPGQLDLFQRPGLEP